MSYGGTLRHPQTRGLEGTLGQTERRTGRRERDETLRRGRGPWEPHMNVTTLYLILLTCCLASTTPAARILHSSPQAQSPSPTVFSLSTLAVHPGCGTDQPGWQDRRDCVVVRVAVGRVEAAELGGLPAPTSLNFQIK